MNTTAKRIAELAARTQELYRKAARRSERLLAANPNTPILPVLAQEERASELAAAAEALATVARNHIAGCSPSWTHRALAQVAEHRRAYLQLTLLQTTASTV